MKRKIAAFLLVIALVFSQTGIIYAKGFSGRSSGGSSRSSHSFSSFRSSSSSSKSYGGWTGSSSSSKSSSSWGSSSSSSSSKSYSGWGGSSSSSSGSRSVPSSYSKTGSAFNTSNSKTGTSKNAYMQSAYNKQASSSNYKAYKQNLNAEQQKVYDSSMNRNYNVDSRLNYNDALNTRNQRISYYDTNPVRVHVNNYYFGGPLSYGSAFVGIWDLWFLMRASDLFWYHHWDDIYPYRSYFNAGDFAARQAAVMGMQNQGIGRNTAYLDPNISPDLQFSQAYLSSHPNSIYAGYKKPASHPFLTLLIIIAFAAVLIWFLRRLLKKPVKPRYSSLY